MSIPRDLLASTAFQAPAFCVYGGAGLLKSHAIHTLPPPVRVFDLGEGGFASYLPWIKTITMEGLTMEYTQGQREAALNMLNAKIAEKVRMKPAPYVDVTVYNPLEVSALNKFTEDIGNFDYRYYSSLALDSLQELSEASKTMSRGVGNEMKTMNEIPFSWVQAQERALLRLRNLRDFRQKGICVYLIGSEDISKDYVKNPMEKKGQGEAKAEAYSIRGTVNLPGKLAEGLAHLPDVLAHAKLMNGNVVWVTEPEMLPGGEAHWDGKDRFGRLERFEKANFRDIFKRLYGEEGMRAIYQSALASTAGQ